MNSNSQPIKLFLVVAFSCTSLLVSLTPVLAKPTVGSSSHRSDAKTPIAQATTFNQPAIPPGPPPGGRVRGGAKRGAVGTLAACPPTKPDLTALVPSTEEANSVINVWGQTTVERPSWFFYVPYSKDSSYTVEFVLQDQDANEIYQKAIALPNKPGIVRVSLPTNAPALEVNKQYRWFFSINCDKEKNSPPTYVEGVIQRVELNPATIKELQTTEPRKRYAIYAQKGIWYEALTALAELRQKNPQDAALKAEWQNLLGSIRLDDVAGEPIPPETP
ncbi:MULTISPECIES: DUF928 domain-containing protein [unclassified Nostoc]|uniref:DUF928 domain-containing protein n=1 Tax=unclassified Nostoc TaxID=2593658 RepID=UPI002AD49605|nr:DUF928 domain-containing protein [Nostoc sp. DedQUE03]MDZ7976093.1 DUF928 domain-containing protein [Nostoc sp. DedQUE03]MDZ8044069.1 DUF928 domain-containing protein [Nostoc sp. DedQUE02]